MKNRIRELPEGAGVCNQNFGKGEVPKRPRVKASSTKVAPPPHVDPQQVELDPHDTPILGHSRL